MKRTLPASTVELVRSLEELAGILEAAAEGLNIRKSPIAIVQVRVFVGTCRLAGARLEELSYLLEELAPPLEPITDLLE